MTLIYEPFSKQAARNPDHIAVEFRNETLSYGELERESNRLARLLCAHGLKRGDRVCLAFPRSPMAVVAAVGVLKAGCTCVSLDLLSPAARAAKVIQVCEPRILLGCSASAALVAKLLSGPDRLPPMVIGWLDAPAPDFDTRFGLAELKAQSDSPQAPRARPEDCAYIVFTSGTTGVPKGVMDSHASLMHYFDFSVAHFRLGPDDRVSSNFAPNFDASIFDIFATLMAGATLCQVPSDVQILPLALAEFIRTQRLTFWWSVPAVLSGLVRFNAVRQGDFPLLTRLAWAGELCPTPVVRHLMQRLPHTQFTNVYGPTECAVVSTYHTLKEVPASDLDEIPIGTACPGEYLMVTDDDDQPVPPETVGELQISGVGVSRGYWGNEPETNRAFYRRGDVTWYRTGDLVRMGRDGLAYFVGRKDSQFKHRGYRIEIGEIETAANAVEALSEVCVVAVGEPGATVICCAYVPKPGVTVAIDVVRAEMATRVPAYMLPTRWVAYQALPRNANGKMDRLRLKDDFSSPVGSPSASAL